MSSQLVPLRKRSVPIASVIPFGLGSQKPRHFLEMARVVWENRDHARYAWRVLSRGVCDGCALGTTGMRDWTLSGTHLCAVRLNLLRLNTIGPIADDQFSDVSALSGMNGKQLRELGRIPYPLRRRRGEPGFSRVSWDEALGEIGPRLRATDPHRVATFMTSRGITNEVYYATQKAMRCYGSPHVDNAARLCHSPSTAAMKRVLGVAASTCSYKDWYGTDVVILFGSNPANDQPVAMKYLLEAKKRGTRVYVVNTYEEPGLKRYWVPSTPESAVFGSEIADGFFHVTTGGDLAFLQAVQRLLIERGQIDHAFVAAHTEGFAELREQLLARDLDDLITASGATRADVERFASLLGEAKSGVLVWSMGLTQHVHGTDTVGALCTLGLLKGFIGREKCGLMPIRGHSGVQGGSEMGAYSNMYPGGVTIDDTHADRLERVWGFRPPVEIGLSTSRMLEAAYEGELDVFYNIGGNLRDTLPDPARVEAALGRVPLRIHQDIVLTHPMLVEPSDTVFLLPARTRYEHRGGVTETTTERRIVFSPYIPGHEIEETREEWWIARELIRAAYPERAALLGLEDAAAIRREIAEAVPSYRGIERLEKQGDQFQWGGPTLCNDGVFPTASGKARLELSPLPQRVLAADQLWLATRRGKQFNSIVQARVDGLTGASRDHIFMHPQDMARFGLSQDARVRLKSAYGSFDGRVFESPVTPGNLQMFWPESNVLLSSGRLDPAGLVPDYNAAVCIERLP